MAASADEESSPAPTVTEGETPAAAAAAAEAGTGAAIEEGMEANKDMAVGSAATVEEPDEEAEVDPDEEAEEEDPEEAGACEGSAGEEEEEDVKRVEAGGDEETVIEALAVVKAGEKGETGEVEEEEPCEVDEDPEEVASEEEPEEPEEGASEGEGMVNDAMKDSMEGFSVNDMNEVSKEQSVGFGGDGKHGDINKDKATDRSGSDGDAGGSGNGEVQNQELAGGLEIFVDELPKDCVEEDFTMVFSQCGEIKSVRIIKNSSTEVPKDIAFVCYANIGAAKKALVQFKDGIEVKGKKVRVSACQDNNKLYLGNICRSWTKDQVMNTLRSMGIGQVEVNLLADRKGRSRGFAFLEFPSHYYARAAFRRLMRPDAIFGADSSAKVSFHRTPTESSEEFLMEVKTVYLEHVPLSWDERKIKKCCEGYGQIQDVTLFHISKNKIFSFVAFSSSKSALACVEGINSAKIVDGGFKLSASLARPKGGLKVNSGAASEDSNAFKKKKDHTEETVVKNSPHKLQKGNKRRLTSLTTEVVVNKSPVNKLPKGNEWKLTSHGAAEVPQTSSPSKRKRTVVKNKNASINQRPPKKARNNLNVDESKLTYHGAATVTQTANPSKGKRKAGKNRNTCINDRSSKKAKNNRNVWPRSSNTTHLGDHDRGILHPPPAGSKYAYDSHHYPSMPAASRSKAHASDLEPHAGYIPPANRVLSTHVGSPHNIYRTDVLPYARDPWPAYSGYASHAGYQTGYSHVYPPPPSTSASYSLGSGRFISGRGDY
ncbi:hypothetical protein ACP70R_021316 [Stipagrostis hirtigluma subsp. patula]